MDVHQKFLKLFLLFVSLNSLAWSATQSIRPQKMQSTVIPTSRNVYTHFLSGLVLERQGKLEHALREYTRTIEIEPGAATVYKQRAELYLKMGRVQDALADLDSYLQLSPKDIDAHLIKANAYIALGDKSAAQEEFNIVLQKDPNHSEALRTLGALVLEDNPAAAVQLFERWQKEDANNPEAAYRLAMALQAMGETAKAEDQLKKALELDPESPAALIMLGQKAQNENQQELAIGYFTQALEKVPDNFALRLALVMLYARSDDFNTIETLLEPYKEDPNAPPEALLWLAAIYENNHQLTRAIPYYEKAQQQLQHSDLALKLAALYSQTQQSEKAVAVLQELTKKNPDSAAFHFFLGLAYVDLNDMRNAVLALQKTIEIDPEYTDAYFQLGIAWDALGKWQRAEKALLQAIELNPNLAAAYNYLGYSYADKNKNLPQARKYIEKALELDPENGAYIDSYGWLQYREGHFEAARATLDHAIEKLTDPEIYNHAGDVALALEDPESAWKLYRRAIQVAEPKSALMTNVNKKLEKLLSDWLAPGSEELKSLTNFDKSLWQGTDLSGTLRLDLGAGGLGMRAAQKIFGTFYLKRAAVSSGGYETTNFRLDLSASSGISALTITWNKEDTTPWKIFPAELGDQISQKDLDALATILTIINGNFEKKFPLWATKIVRKKGHELELAQDHSSIVLNTQTHQLESFNRAEAEVRISSWRQTTHGLLPEELRFSWRDNADQKQQAKLKFFALRFDLIESKIFTNETKQ